MPTIRVKVEGKIATNLTPQEKVVWDNDDYKVEFEFDETWAKANLKTGLFIVNGELIAQPFDGNICPMPIIKDTTLLAIGVKTSNGSLYTTTPAYADCLKSASGLAKNEIPAPSKDVYDQIMDLLNKYIEIGAMTEEDITGLIDEKTAHLQEKVDEDLQTESKEVVGAINETYDIAKSGKEVSEEVLSKVDKIKESVDNATEKSTTAEENSNTALQYASEAKGMAEQANATSETAHSKANEALESLSFTMEIAERAEEKVDALDEITAQSLKIASQSLNLANEADNTANHAKENMVYKTERANQLYGTDENGNPALYSTDSVGTQVFIDGQKVKEFNADEKFDKKGGVVGGSVSIQGNLSVSGTTTTKDTETLQVKDNVVVANADGVELVDDSGFAIKTSKTEAYGIMYSPVGNGVKIGLGSFDENGKFAYEDLIVENEDGTSTTIVGGQAQFLATRADFLGEGHIPKWDSKKNQFVDSGEKIDDYVKTTDFEQNKTQVDTKIENIEDNITSINTEIEPLPDEAIDDLWEGYGGGQQTFIGKEMVFRYHELPANAKHPIKRNGYYMCYSNSGNLNLCQKDGTVVVGNANQMQFMVSPLADNPLSTNLKACGTYLTGSSFMSGGESFRRSTNDDGYITADTEFYVCEMVKHNVGEEIVNIENELTDILGV